VENPIQWNTGWSDKQQHEINQFIPSK